jgi:uncharacterized repeat protein (TIGR03806 family)
MWKAPLAIISIICFLLSVVPDKDQFQWPKYLSEWALFEGELSGLNPIQTAIPYHVRSPLFSDYAHKQRFIILPEGTQMGYKADGPLDFPEGAILVKSFYYPSDFSKPENDLQVMETRLMILQNDKWHAASYAWNREQTDAKLAIGGSGQTARWIDNSGKIKTLNYSIPNANQCTNCHINNGVVKPLGITARQLNHNGAFQQLQSAGLISGMPIHDKIPLMADYRDPSSGTLDERARAYLDVNCAHCHRPEGPANSSGLYLQYTSRDNHQLGIMKSPVAAGRGSGGKKYNIVPGKPKASILLHRMVSDDPGVRMPELGRQLQHQEGIDLIRDWIKSLK